MAEKEVQKKILRHPQGNVLKLAIPLTLQTITIEGGEATATTTSYTPSSNYPVTVEFGGNPKTYTRNATIRNGTVACVEDKGTLPVGIYAMTVRCNDDNGDPRRFKQKCVLKVVDLTADAGLPTGTEFESQEHILDAAVFFAVSGEDGRSVVDTSVQESTESGGYNIVTFYYSDGTTSSFRVRNGLGIDATQLAEYVKDSNYTHTDNNYTNEDKALVQGLNTIVNSAFGKVVYDSNAKLIRFYAYGDNSQTNLLGSFSTAPFENDGMLNNIYINSGYLVFSFNNASNRPPIYIPLSDIFDRTNYYTKAQVSVLLNSYYTASTIDNKLAQKASLTDLANKADKDTNTERVPYGQTANIVLDFINGVDEEVYEVGYGTIFGDTNGHIKYVDEYEHSIDVGFNKGLVYFNKADGKFYYYTNSWQQVVMGGGGTGDVTGVKVGSTTYEATDGVVDISAAIPDVSGKADKSEMSVTAGTGANADKTTIQLKSGTSATVLTQHQDISGKADKSTTYTKPEVNALIDNIEAGETAVVSMDDIDIIDGHSSQSILAAGSARMVRELYVNLKALFDNLAGCAFADTIPTWETVSKYTYSFGLSSADEHITVTAKDGSDNTLTGEQNEGTAMTITLSVANGYKFTAAPTATMGSKNLTVTASGSDYVIEIGALAGNVVITAASQQVGTYSVSIPTGAEFCDSSGDSASTPSITEGDDLTCYIKPSSGKQWDTAPTSSDATVTLHSGTIYKIEASDVDDDITISGTTKDVSKVTITKTLRNVTLTDNADGNNQINEGGNYSASATVIDRTGLRRLYTDSTFHTNFPTGTFSPMLLSSALGTVDGDGLSVSVAQDGQSATIGGTVSVNKSISAVAETAVLKDCGYSTGGSGTPTVETGKTGKVATQTPIPVPEGISYYAWHHNASTLGYTASGGGRGYLNILDRQITNAGALGGGSYAGLTAESGDTTIFSHSVTTGAIAYIWASFPVGTGTDEEIRANLDNCWIKGYTSQSDAENDVNGVLLFDGSKAEIVTE